MRAWSLFRPANPAVLRLDTSVELTDATIETCPPVVPPPPLDRLLALPEIRSIDLHRYRARLNLVAGSDAEATSRRVREVMVAAWGPASSRRGEPPRPFVVPYAGPRLVAESLRMAGRDPILEALFGVRGVVEAVLEPGEVRVRLGGLFSWDEVEEDVRRALTAGSRGSPEGRSGAR